ncbi:MAG: helix-turn-helix domain-containing protein [Chitinophagaceae bacterium]
MKLYEQPKLRAISSSTQKLPLYITELNNDYWIYQNPERTRLKNDDYEIIWLTRGSDIFKLDLHSFELSNHLLLFVKPGQPYTFPAHADLEGYIIHINPTYDESSYREFDSSWQRHRLRLFNNQYKLNTMPDEREDLNDVLIKMLKACNHPNDMSTDILKRYFSIFLLYLSRQIEQAIPATAATRNGEVVRQFIGLLDKHFKEKKMVADYAQSLSLSPNYLNEIVKKFTGHSAGYHIRQRIILEAKRMLFYSDTCRKEIAYSLGFNDMAHFSKFFKAATGRNFTDFKKEKAMFSFSPAVAV